MVFGLAGRETDVPIFSYFLAEKLGCMVADLDRMAHAEYIHWSAYYTAHHQATTMRKVF